MSAHMSMTAALRNALRAGTVLFLFALVGTAILAFTHDRANPIIISMTTTCWPASKTCRQTISWARVSPHPCGSPVAASRSPPWYWKPSPRTVMLAISPC